jgi:hypothetical protein
MTEIAEVSESVKSFIKSSLDSCQSLGPQMEAMSEELEDMGHGAALLPKTTKRVQLFGKRTSLSGHAVRAGVQMLLQ